MAFYSFNGTVLTELPVSSGYQVIFTNGAYHVLAVSSGPWLVLDGTHIGVTSGCSVRFYLSSTTASIWVDITDSQDQPNPAYTWTNYATTSQYVWSSHDIEGINVVDGVPESQGTVYSGTTPTWAAPDVPVFSYYGWTDGDGSYSTNTLTIPVKKAGWSLTVDLRLKATVTDGGHMVAGWYKNGVAEVARESDSGSITSTCKIDNSTVGTLQYRGEAWDIINGVERGKIGDTITVNVVDWDYDDYDPDSGNNEEGSFSPGTFVPDEAFPQTPVLTLVGEDATYKVGDVAATLICSATVTDGGTLSYQWYDGDTVVSTSSTFRPPTNEVGVKSYYCIVTNSLNGYTASEVSDMVTITVEEEGAVEQRGFCQTSFSIGVATGVRLEGKPYGGVKT